MTKRQTTLFYFLALAVGVAVGMAVAGFVRAIGLVQWLGFGSSNVEALPTVAAALPWWLVALVPAAGGLAVGLLVHFCMPHRRNHGVADVMEAVVCRDGRMDGRAGLGAALSATVSLGCGASVGREGPAVHIGASLSAWVARRLNLTRQMSLTLLGGGAAAAVAASFNAPLAGVLFAMEVVVGQYVLRVFMPVVVASVAATLTARELSHEALLQLPSQMSLSLGDVPGFVALGLVCGALALALVHGSGAVQKCAAVMVRPAWLRPAAAGVVVGAIALWQPWVLGVGYQATNLTLNMHELTPLSLVAAILAAKLAATVVSLGGGFGGGVFSPSLVLGSLAGGALALVFTAAFPAAAPDSGVFALAGMTGVAAAVLGAPISTIVIVFELTADLGLTVAVMITATVAVSATHKLVPGGSFFTWQARQRGVKLGE